MIAIISDIHGNYAALEAVLGKIDEIGAHRVICLGDIGGYYSQINQCCDELRSRNIYSLLGNHDWYLANNEDCPRSTSANRCLDYQRSVLTAENLNWISSLKPQAEVDGISIVHGGWEDPIDEYVTPSSAYFSERPGKYFASGHTHVPCIWFGSGKVYCNPGAVGQPRDGDPRASFAIWENREFSLHRVEYDIASVQKDMSEAGFESYFYENLNQGARIGGKVDHYQLLT